MTIPNEMYVVNVGIIGRSWCTEKLLQDGSRVILVEPDPGYDPYFTVLLRGFLVLKCLYLHNVITISN